MPDPPSFLAQFKTPAPDPAPPPPTRSGAGPVGFDNAVIEAELGNVRRATEGTRNATLNQAAFNLAQVYPPDTVLGPLLEAASQCGLGRFEAERTIRSGFTGAARNPRPAHRMPRTDKINRPLEDLPSIDGYTEPGHDPLDAFNVVNWPATWADTTELEWLLEPLIPTGRLIALYSPPKVGKSLLMLELAVAISKGTPALGAPTQRAKVLYLDYENDPQTDIKARLIDMGYTPGDLTDITYASFPAIPPLDTPAGGHALLTAAQHVGAGLVIVDTISRAISGAENDNDTWLALYRCTGMHLKSNGISMLRLDHSGKDLDKGQRGGSAKLGDVDAVWRMTTLVQDESYQLDCEAARYPTVENNLTLRRSAGPLAHHVDTRAIGEVKREAILRVLDEADLPKDAGRDRCRAALRTAGIKVRDTTLADIIKTRKGPLADWT